MLTGRDAIAAVVLDTRVPLDTTHVVTNCRVRIDGDTAALTAQVAAQHLPCGDHRRHALLKNLYAAHLVRDDARWVIQRVQIDNVWYVGDPKVLIGQ